MADLTVDLITRLIAESTINLRQEVERLRSQVEIDTRRVTDYVTESIDENIQCQESLDVVKSLPDFSGKLNSYVSWREAAHNAMSLYIRKSRRYFAALTILRNKITQDANDTLTNHGTVLNFDAIIARLDFAYSDKRPIHIIEQELSVLRQGSMTVVEYYNLVNRKLTLLINKTIMTHSSSSDIAKELNKKNRDHALRIFVTGLNAPLRDIIFSLNPQDLPDALAKAQELESNNQRALFAKNFANERSRARTTNYPNNNLRFPTRNNVPKPEPMDVDPSVSRSYNKNYNPFGQQGGRYFNQNNKPQTSSSDNGLNTTQQSSGPQNQHMQGFKRRRESNNSFRPQGKTPKINNLNEEHFLGKRETTSPTS